MLLHDQKQIAEMRLDNLEGGGTFRNKWQTVIFTNYFRIAN